MSRSDRRLRLVLVGRHFWPHGSFDAAGHLIQLASNLHSLGQHVEVVVPRQANSCSEKFQFREFDVHRPLRMFRTGWSGRGDRSATKYIKSLREWLCQTQRDCDLIYCDSAQEECIAAVQAAKHLQVPAVVRIAGMGTSSDLSDSQGRRNVKHCVSTAMKADAIVVNNATIQRRLIIDGFGDAKTCRIPIGIGQAIQSPLQDKTLLRTALARINGDLHLFEGMSVVLSVERMQTSSGISTLVQTARILSERISGLQYWFIGDGPKRDAIFSHLKGEGLRQAMAMPGSFGIMDDVFGASDLMVHTGDDGYQSHVPRAIQMEIPLVIANTEVAREFFAVSSAEVQQQLTSADFDSPIRWFNPERPRSLRLAIESILDDPEAAKRQAVLLRKHMQGLRNEDDSLRQYMQLFRRLVDQFKAAAGDRQLDVQDGT
ncbi:hypothetical protein LOC67_21430 [Stieleria sp. JC731]|uniref:glycosyltransferase n=1 Tax=Pirellulaceae TaxID=2691357 RepID=UPI001E4F920B|nr:glycosyltransferase [Stieleria sp. JC731]MCC9603120.1 hypothetical protein [Stieleria sp. JC731]